MTQVAIARAVLRGFRQWHVEFPLMCVGLLIVKTPPTRCFLGKTPGSIRHLFTTTHRINRQVLTTRQH